MEVKTILLSKSVFEDNDRAADELRAALRKARDINAGEDDWKRIIEMLESQEKKGGNS